VVGLMRWGRKEAPVPGTENDWLVIGAPLAGTQNAVDGIDRGGGRADALVAADPAFNMPAFVNWSKTVYDRAVEAWRTGSPEPLRPVMDDAVWNHYAQHLLAISTVPLAASLMGAVRGTPHLDGSAADAVGQSAVIGFDVATDPSVASSWGLDGKRHTWSERWLFQRPASSKTHESGAVAVCHVCGAPAQPEETGRCRYCHADITTRTAGWLVTRIATTLQTMAKMDARIEKVRAEMWQEMAAKRPGGAPVQAPRAGAPPQPPRADV
jgi:hypothetical protein